jgi:hypothetical protein
MQHSAMSSTATQESSGPAESLEQQSEQRIAMSTALQEKAQEKAPLLDGASSSKAEAPKASAALCVCYGLFNIVVATGEQNRVDCLFQGTVGSTVIAPHI